MAQQYCQKLNCISEEYLTKEKKNYQNKLKKKKQKQKLI